VTAANPADILAGVERWARVRGWCRDQSRTGAYWPASQPWIVEVGQVVTIWQGATQGARPLFEVSPALALAWALLVETEAGPVDVGRCSACGGVGTVPGERPSWANPHGEPPEPCGCYGGREAIPAARLLLDAAPRKFGTSALAVYGDRPVINGIEQGDAVARERLLVHADHLQATGDQRGELLALALGPWSGEPVDCGECPDCKGRGLVPGDPPSWANPYGEPPEDCGCGDGRVVGHPGTADALRWLEWLTWAREFAAEREAQAPTLRDEVESLARASVLSYADTFDLVARAKAAGATYTERLRLGVHGMVMLVNAYESGALAPARRPG
jgi:hypothetical protein